MPANRPLIHKSDAHFETSNKLDKSRSGKGSAISLRMALRRKKANSLGFETIQQNLKVMEESACLEVKYIAVAIKKSSDGNLTPSLFGGYDVNDKQC